MNNIHEMTEPFVQQAEHTRQLLTQMMDCLQQQRPPAKELAGQLQEAVTTLQARYEALRKWAAQRLDISEMPAEDAPVDAYARAIADSRRMGWSRSLDMCLRVSTAIGRYQEALTQLQGRVFALKQCIEGGDAFSRDELQQYQAFAEAVDMGEDFRQDNDRAMQLMLTLENTALPMPLVVGLMLHAFRMEPQDTYMPAAAEDALDAELQLPPDMAETDGPETPEAAAEEAARAPEAPQPAQETPAAAEEAPCAPEAPQPAQESPAAAEEAPRAPEAPQPAQESPAAAQTPPQPVYLWPESDSYYRGGCTVKIEDKASKPLGVESFKQHANAHAGEMDRLLEIANALMFNPYDVSDEQARAAMLDPNWSHRIHGYVHRITIRMDDTSCTYLCLSEATRYLLGNPAVRSYLHNRRNDFSLRPIHPECYVSSAMITDAFACQMMYMLFYARQCGSRFSPLHRAILWNGVDWKPDRRQKDALMMALFTPGTEQEDLAWMRSMVQRANENGVTLTILTVSAKETELIRRVLALPEEQLACVRFVACDEAPEEDEPALAAEAQPEPEAPAPQEEAPEPQEEEAPVPQEETEADAARPAPPVDEPLEALQPWARDEVLPAVGESQRKPIARKLSTSGERCSDYVARACEAYANGRGDVGGTMLRSLSVTHEGLEETWARWACAAGDPAYRRQRLPAELLRLYGSNADRATSALALAALLRMYCSADAQQEHWIRTGRQMQAYLQRLPEASPTLEMCMLQLDVLVEECRAGLTAAVFAALGNAGYDGAKLALLQSEARRIIDGRPENPGAHDEQIVRLYGALLGEGAALRMALEAVAAGDLEAGGSVRELLQGLHPQLLTDGAAAEAVMTSEWERMGGSALSSRHHNNLTCRMGRCIGVIARWLDALSAGESSCVMPRQLDVAQSLRAQLPVAAKELAEGAAQLTSAAERGAMRVLLDTVTEIAACLAQAQAPTASAAYYLALAAGDPREPQSQKHQPAPARHERKEQADWEDAAALQSAVGSVVVIQEDGLPCIFSDQELLDPYEQCRSLEPLVAQARPELAWAANQFIRASASSSFVESLCGGNYGNGMRLVEAAGDAAAQLEDYDPERVRIYCASGQSKLRQEKERFRGQMEMAAARGWFEHVPESQIVIESVALNKCERCEATHNYTMALLCLKEAMQWARRQAQQHWSAMLEERLRQAMEKYSIFEDSPATNRIRRLIDQASFTAAEDAIKAAGEHGFFDLPDGALTESTCFTDFLRTYAPNYGMVNNNMAMEQFMAYSPVPTGIRMDGEEFLEKWPLRPGRMLSNAGELLACMNLQTAACKPHPGLADGSHACVTFSPAAASQGFEQHPFAAFGSRMLAEENGLDLVYLPPCSDVSGYLARMGEALNRTRAQAILFVINAALSLAERRQIATRIWHNPDISLPFIFVDRVLAYYLAQKPREQRWNALLQCALPFAMVRPYVISSTAIIPPEMFVGRVEELRRIENFVNDKGANLVYGGRQLGKTALLYRVVQKHHDPAQEKYAVVATVRKRNVNQAVPIILRELRVKGFPGAEAQAEDGSWSAMCDWLSATLEAHPGMMLRLMIDEADVLLTTAAEDNYSAIDDLRNVQRTFPERFKFVLAGVHNVLRLSGRALEANSPLVHLGCVAVGPLPYSDAEQLLRRPLSYLGFEFDGSERQQALISTILNKTNYYPGLIHHYCDSLLATIGEGQAVTVPVKPPHELDENLIARLLVKDDFQQATKDRFLMTICVEEGVQYYYILSCMLALCCYEKPEAKLGVPQGEFLRVAKDYGIGAITALNPQSLHALLEELCQLNIFRKSEGDVVLYRFARPDFQSMLGTDAEVLTRMEGFALTEVNS